MTDMPQLTCQRRNRSALTRGFHKHFKAYANPNNPRCQGSSSSFFGLTGYPVRVRDSLGGETLWLLQNRDRKGPRVVLGASRPGPSLTLGVLKEPPKLSRAHPVWRWHSAVSCPGEER